MIQIRCLKSNLLPKIFPLVLKSFLLAVVLLYAGINARAGAVVTSFAPHNGPVGTLVTLKGTGLSASKSVIIGGVAAIIVSNSSTKLVAMVMPGTTGGAVNVVFTAGSVTATGTFTVTATPYPVAQQGRKLVDTVKQQFMVLDYSRGQGTSVAVSADGNTAIVGLPKASVYLGGVIIYIRKNGRWAPAGPPIHSDAVAGMGTSVAISADGSTAIVGGFYSTSASPVTVLKRVNGSWANPAIKHLNNNDEAEPGSPFPRPPYAIGNAVSITADGRTIILGNDRPFYNSSQYNANVKIYNRSGTEWVQVPTPQAGAKFLGYNSKYALLPPVGIGAAISGDGKTIALIAQAYGGGRGSAATPGYTAIYRRSGRSLNYWKAEKALHEYSKVSLTADGNTLVAYFSPNAFDPATYPGYTDIYARNGATWALLQTIHENGPASISADGKTLITANNATVYTRVGATYMQKIILKPGYAGLAASLSTDGSTAFIGNPNDNTTLESHPAGWDPSLNLNGEIGAAYAFSSSPAELPASAITFANTTGTTTSVSWANGTGTGRAVFIKDTTAGEPSPQDIYYSSNVRYKSGYPIGNTGWYCIYNGTGSTVNVVGLVTNKTYRVAVMEYKGTIDEPQFFQTEIVPANVTTPLTPPTGYATGLAFSNTTATSTTLSWVSSNGAARAVFLKLGTTGELNVVQSQTYAANNNFGLGAQAGTNGWYCVYNGTGDTVNISGLTALNTYSAVVIEYNGSPGMETYNLSRYNAATVTTPKDVPQAPPAPDRSSASMVFAHTTSKSSILLWSMGSGTSRSVFIKAGSTGEPEPVDGVVYTANNPYTQGSPINSSTGNTGWYCVYTGTGDYVALSGLSPSTTYRVAVVDYNGGSGSVPTAFIKSFVSANVTTLAPSATPIGPSPYLSFSNTTATTSTISWGYSDGERAAVFVSTNQSYGFRATDNITYTANTTFGLGSTPEVKGFYCVYNGTGSTVNISGLQPSTRYIAIVVEYNGSPGHELYSHQVSGEEVTTAASANRMMASINSIGIAPENTSGPVVANNILSPNGDGKNDVWIVNNIEYHPGNTVNVVDAGGNTVFNKKGYTNDWAGTYRGGVLKEGTYYYTIDLGNSSLIKGFFTVVRDR